MTFAPDISGDWAYVDGIETVKLITRENDGEKIAKCNGAQRQEMGPSGLKLFGGTIAIDPDDLIWHLPKAGLKTTYGTYLEPKESDRIKDAAGTVWRIKEVVYAAMVEIWHCNTCKESE
jgi:hypothetical protein